MSNSNNLGGARKGAGRKPKLEEDKVIKLAETAIITKYGTLEAGFVALLASGEPSLMKFVWEHAVGKPKDKVDVGGEFTISIIHE